MTGLRRRLSGYRQELRHALTPGLVDEILEARRFARRSPGTRGGLRSYRLAKQARLDLIPPDIRLDGRLVVDLGANVGDWTAAVLSVLPDVRIIAVEPAPGPGAQLVARFASAERVSIDQRAVSDQPGRAHLHVTEHSHATSLRRPRKEMNALYPGGGWDVVGTVEVEVTTVDELLSGQEPSLIKVDVQGSESEVLAGARRTLETTDALLLEVTFVSHYGGDATFPRLHELVSDMGFELVALSDPWPSSRGTILWMDACYRRV